MEIFTQLTPWHWLALALLLLGAEALGAAGFLLGAAIAAFASAVVVWLFPDLAAGAQLGIFALGAVLATVVWFQLFRDVQDDHDTGLNAGAARLIGTHLVLTSDIPHREGREQIGDTYWKLLTDEPLPEGTEVEVIAADTMHLKVRAV